MATTQKERGAMMLDRWAHRLGDSAARLAEYPGGFAPGRFITKTELLTLRKLLSHSLADRPGHYRDVIPTGDASAIWAMIDAEENGGPLYITRAHALQGLNYLHGLAWTPRGKVRESSPFGYRERAVIEGAWTAWKTDQAHALARMFALVDFWDAGSHGWPFFLPVFRLHGMAAGGCFDYIGRSWQVDTWNRNNPLPFVIG